MLQHDRLHLGCGNKILPGWINCDFSTENHPEVLAFDCVKKWPFPADYFAAVYTCHTLEHLTDADVKKTIKNIHASLKKGGIFRVSVPDLEYNCKIYVECCARNRRSCKIAEKNKLKWARLNLTDQYIRKKTGGETKEFIEACDPETFKYIVQTTGGLEVIKIKDQPPPGKARTLRNLWRRIVAADPQKALQPEIHKSFFDEFKLTEILDANGFRHIRRMREGISRIPRWNALYAEMNSRGASFRPNSLILEAIR